MGEIRRFSVAGSRFSVRILEEGKKCLEEGEIARFRMGRWRVNQRISTRRHRVCGVKCGLVIEMPVKSFYRHLGKEF